MLQKIDKRKLLKHIYNTYDEYSQKWAIACQRYCSTCCTDRLWITTLEARFILDYLYTHNMKALLNKIHEIPASNRYHPKTTINQEAVMSVQDASIPEADETPLQTCIFLKNNECLIYPNRPMCCRSMVSQTKCMVDGYANMSPLHMSLATICYQFIEAFDIHGDYGNYLNILETLIVDPEIQPIQHTLSKQFVLKNQTIQYLMIPPEHQADLEPFIAAIQDSPQVRN